MAGPFDFNDLARRGDPSMRDSPHTSPRSQLGADQASHSHSHSHQHLHQQSHHHQHHHSQHSQSQNPFSADSYPVAHHTGNVTIYQTAGPDAYTSAILSPGGSGLPALNPRSCVTCRRRKVRCDKQMPCSNCRRSLIPCAFPAPGRAPRQPRPKDLTAQPKNSGQREAELVRRLRKLEGIVEELSGQIEVESAHRGPSAAGSPESRAAHGGGGLGGSSDRTIATTARHNSHGAADAQAGTLGSSPTQPDSHSDHGSDATKRKDVQKQFGRLVLSDQKGSTRYVSSGFWSKLNDELDAIREERHRLNDDETDDSDLEGIPESPRPKVVNIAADHHAFLLGYRSADVDLQQCHPLPSHVAFLWSIYQENVEPLVKLLHVPSMEAVFRDARNNTQNLSPGNQALVFAIYFSAVTSVEDDELQSSLGVSKNDLLIKYRFSLEQALAKASFLNTSDIAVLQSFILFLIVARRHDDSRFCWSLTGLIIRLAQGMGLHRDGTHFDLLPLETEIRRRVWWAILTLDLRSAEEMGSDLAINDAAFDTEMPSNINDSDLGPSTKEPPVPREGRSDTAVPILRYEITGLSRRLLTASSAMASLYPTDNATDGASITEREHMLVDLYHRLEHKFLRHVVDEVDALFWIAAMIARVIMSKMCLIIYQPILFPGSDVELSEEIRQRIYVAALEVIEYNHKLNTEQRCKQYRWLFGTYTNWHAIAYILLETCRRPWNSLVERGWDAVHAYEREPLEAARNTEHTAVFLPLRKLFMRARKHRIQEVARLKADEEEAKRLDFAERKNPARSRFGAAPGTENRMSDVREAWRQLVTPDDATSPIQWATEQPPPPPPPPPPTTQPKQQATQQATTNQERSMPPPPPHSSTPTYQTQAGPSQNTDPRSDPSTSGPPPDQVNMTPAAMQFMDDIMLRSGPNINVTELWRINGEMNGNPPGRNMNSQQPPPYGQPVNNAAAGQQRRQQQQQHHQHPQHSQHSQQQQQHQQQQHQQQQHQHQHQQQQHHQQQQQHQQQQHHPQHLQHPQQPHPARLAKSDHVPPYLWAGPNANMGPRSDEPDMDMLTEEFDWQDWSQNIRGLELETATPHVGWGMGPGV